MRSIPFFRFMAVATAFAVVGCAKRDETIAITEATPAEIEAQKEWQAQVDEQEGRLEKLGIRHEPDAAQIMMVQSLEMEHRQLEEKLGSQVNNGSFLKVRQEEMEHRRQTGESGKAKKNTKAAAKQ